MPKLTETLVANTRPDGRDRIIFDSGLAGFGLRITAAGNKLYIVRAAFDRKRRYAALGEPPGLKLVDARKLAIRALEAIREGRDPAQERLERERAAAAGVMTVSALAERWMAEIVTTKRKPRTASDYQRLIDQRIGPAFGHMAVAKVKRDDVLRWHASMSKTPRRANYAASVFRALMNFAEDVGLRPEHTNPARRLEMYREGVRERFLSEAEIAKAADGIAKAAADGRIGPHAAAGLRIALLTGARSGEITALMWKYLDRSRNVVRLPDSKTNVPRDIHLSPAALDVLGSIPRIEPYIIAGSKPGEPYKNLGRAWIVARAYVGLDDVRLHDLRHSYASLAANRGVSLQIIGKLLGHRVPATTQRYAHLARDVISSINDELGAAMADAIAKGTNKPGNVIKLKQQKGRK